MRRATLYPKTSLQRSLMLACLAQLAMLSPASAEPVLALDMTDGTSVFWASTTPATLGWRFSLAQPRRVVALGYFDDGTNGFGESHVVRLWTDAGALLAKAIVTSSSTVESSTHAFGSWRFVDLTSPVYLWAGSYRIGGVDNGIDSHILNGTLTMEPGVTFDSGAALPADGFPAESVDAHFGPNLKLEPGVPPTNNDSPFRRSPEEIWVYHSRDGDGGYDFVTVLQAGRHDLGIWATAGANESAAGPPLCITSADPPTGDEICALDFRFQLSGDGELVSFTSETFPATEDSVNEAGTLLKANVTSAGAPLRAGYPPQQIGVLTLEVGGGPMTVWVDGVEGIGAAGDTLPVAIVAHPEPPPPDPPPPNVLFVPEPSEYLLLASGIGMLALLGRYRRLRTP